MTDLCLLDTDTVSALIRQTSAAIANARLYLARNERLSLSAMTRFEVLRGLHAKRATTRIDAFEEFCSASDVLPVTDAIIVRAASIYGDLHRRGQLIGDADILIAATAIEHNLVLVSHNVRHFSRIDNLRVIDWF